ncbi:MULTISPECIES: ACP S-malonyltransferase [Bacillales]|uniref:ACP S-malonyltransferase n=1 Tax=Bacillales TaxID=1385 RepID=UPI00034C94E6|nr:MULTISPECIES: ACP S-malonyltransferase [Bacillales]KMZ40661.1 malonyl-CoA transacylase [Bacillus sp. FJAT-27238]
MDKIALLFPGQGSQYVGMGQALCEAHPIAARTFEEASDALGFNLQTLCFAGDVQELTKTEHAQPAILTASVAAFRVYSQDMDIEPKWVAGHSLGEFTALTCAGAIQFADAVRLVYRRGQFMQAATPQGVGAMSAIFGLDAHLVEEICREHSRDGAIVVVANHNSADQIVISGHAHAVRQVEEACKQQGSTSVVTLKVSAPFHSPLMVQAAEQLKEELKRYTYCDPRWPVISNVTAQPYVHADQLVDLLTAQTTSPVRWQATMDYLVKQGANTVIELGPKSVLTNLAKKYPLHAFAFDKQGEIDRYQQELQDAKTRNQAAIAQFVDSCIAIAVCTKNRGLDEEAYQQGVITPYQALQQLRQQLEQGEKEGSYGDVREAFSLLRLILQTKKAPDAEQAMRFEQLTSKPDLQQRFPEISNEWQAS